MRIKICSLAIAVSLAQQVLAETVAKSSETRVSLIELYSSESCSSCPPADKWISQLKENRALWQSFVPIVFHVDYWNHLSWKDEYSGREMTERQKAHAATWLIPRVYTPAFVVDGAEWQGWKESTTPGVGSKTLSGTLTVTRVKGDFQVTFTSKEKTLKRARLNLAILGMGMQTNVTAGENSGSTLAHDFVVLNWQNKVAEVSRKGEVSSHFSNLSSPKKRKGTAVVAWVESDSSPTPIQATGAFLKE